MQRNYRVSQFSDFTVSLLTMRSLDNIRDLLDDLHNIQFRGIIHIEDIRRLSELGQRWLLDDLQLCSPLVDLVHTIKTTKLRVLIQASLSSEPEYLRERSRKSFHYINECSCHTYLNDHVHSRRVRRSRYPCLRVSHLYIYVSVVVFLMGFLAVE